MKLVGYLVVLSMLLTLAACAAPQVAPLIDGDVARLFAGTSKAVITDVLAGKPGAVMYVKDGLIVFGKAIGDGYGFVVTDQATRQVIENADDVLLGIEGNLVNMSTWADFQKWMIENGWVPASVAAQNYYQFAFSFANTALPTFLVLPAGVDIESTYDSFFPDFLEPQLIDG